MFACYFIVRGKDTDISRNYEQNNWIFFSALLVEGLVKRFVSNRRQLYQLLKKIYHNRINMVFMNSILVKHYVQELHTSI